MQRRAIEVRVDSHHNLAVLALAHYHNGEEAGGRANHAKGHLYASSQGSNGGEL